MYPYIKTIWNKATKEMQNAKKIIIWGYSLPPTDFYSQWLLRQARDSIKELILINPEVKSGEFNLLNKNTSFINKFTNLYKSNISSSEVKLYEEFNEFIDKRELEDKYNLNE